MFTTHQINKNFYLCTPDARKIEINQRTLRQGNVEFCSPSNRLYWLYRIEQRKDSSKPVVLLLSWLQGSKKNISKYSKLYTDQGLDVLVGQPSAVSFMFSLKSSEVCKNLQQKSCLSRIYFHSNTARTSMISSTSTKITTRIFTFTVSLLEQACGEWH